MASATARNGRPGGAASGGWPAPIVTLLVGAAIYVPAAAWVALAPRTAPAPAALVAAASVVGLVEFVLAATFALAAAHPPAWWRPGAALAVAAAGALAAATASVFSAWGVLGAGVAAAIAARAGETLGRHLAPVLALPRDDTSGDWSRQAPETRRIVLELWLLAALAAAVVPSNPALIAALGLAAAAGMLLITGAKLSSVQRLAAQDGVRWSAADLALAWRGAATLALGVVAVAVWLPSLPPLLSLRFVHLIANALDLLFRPVARHHAVVGHSSARVPPLVSVSGGGRAAHGSSAGRAATNGQPARHRSNPLSRLSALLTAVFELRNLLPVLAVPVILLIAAIGVVRALRAYGGDWRGALAHLWAALTGLFGFWRWFAGPGDLRRAAAPRPDDVAVFPAAPSAGRSVVGGFGARRAVRAAYRRFLRDARVSGQERSAAETPADFARRLEPVLQGGAGAAADLTQAYEEARFSDHAIGRQSLPWVRQALARAVAALRRAGRRG